MLPKSTGSRYPTRSNVATGPSITAATTPPGASCLLSDPAQATPPSAVDSVDSNSVDPEAAPTDNNNNEADSAGDPSISQYLPGRTPKACECRYAFLRHRPEWNESWKNSIAYWYQQYKSELWAHVSEKTRLPERDIEALVWHLGPWEIARRAAVAQHIA
ncbi:hypothetical protein CBS147353_11475 [Aspergillus niger]|nr:hypothetical protein CBS147353_11475 [Aspergillus niger]